MQHINLIELISPIESIEIVSSIIVPGVGRQLQIINDNIINATNYNQKPNMYGLSVTQDISSATITSEFDRPVTINNNWSGYWKPDGMKFYQIGISGGSMYQTDCISPFSVSGSTTITMSFPFLSTYFTNIKFSQNGLIMYAGHRTLNYGICVFNLSVAWELSTAVISYINTDFKNFGWCFYDNGNYVISNNAVDGFIEISRLSSPFDLMLGSVTIKKIPLATAIDTGVSGNSGMDISSDEKYLYYLSAAKGRIYQLEIIKPVP